MNERIPPTQTVMPSTFEPALRTARRYSLLSDNSELVKKKVDNFGNLVNLIQQIILLYGGQVSDDSQFGQLLAKAAKVIEERTLIQIKSNE